MCVCSNHRAPGVSVCYIWQWVKQCLCGGCWRSEDQYLLCGGRSVPSELEVSLSRTTTFLRLTHLDEQSVCLSRFEYKEKGPWTLWWHHVLILILSTCIPLICRLCLAYGGSDVTRTFFWLLQRAGFPYRDCQLSNRLDCQLLQQLKETFCHLDQVCVFFSGKLLLNVISVNEASELFMLNFYPNLTASAIVMYSCILIYSKRFVFSTCSQQDTSGLQDHEFQTRFPEAPALLYQVRLGDEKLQVQYWKSVSSLWNSIILHLWSCGQQKNTTAEVVFTSKTHISSLGQNTKTE